MTTGVCALWKGWPKHCKLGDTFNVLGLLFVCVSVLDFYLRTPYDNHITCILDTYKCQNDTVSKESTPPS